MISWIKTEIRKIRSNIYLQIFKENLRNHFNDLEVNMKFLENFGNQICITLEFFLLTRGIRPQSYSIYLIYGRRAKQLMVKKFQRF
jgi:hypothetical protein